jgi:rare lipoprotein A (peptidoglycan hydrolase)
MMSRGGVNFHTVMNLRCTITRILLATSMATLVSCARPAFEQRGYGSYIADHYAGRQTSSGDIYQPQAWTAAHNSLPYGSHVKVKNNANGRSVNLVVNDRFPNYPNRVINVSQAAAMHLQIPFHQMADVTVTSDTVPITVAAPPAYYGAPAPAYTGAPPPAYSSSPPPAYYNSAPPPSVPPPAYTGAPPPGYGLPPAY